ncbi:MAG: hypothetical protein ACF8QF_12395 [Phycisphaerales bacterium]
MPATRHAARSMLAGFLAALGVTAGCNNAGQGAVSGGALGALAGVSIGSLSGTAGEGAIIGLVSGALAGGVIGDQNMRADLRAGGASSGAGGRAWGDDRLPEASEPVQYDDPYTPDRLRARYGDPPPPRYGPEPEARVAPVREPQAYGPSEPNPVGSRVVASGTVPSTAAIARAGVRAEYRHQAMLKAYGEGDLGYGEVYGEAPVLNPSYGRAVYPRTGNVDLHTAYGSTVSHDCSTRCDHIYCSHCGSYHDSLRYYTVCSPRTTFGLRYSYSPGGGSWVNFSYGWWDWYDWDYACRYGYTTYRPYSHWRYTYRPYSWWGWSTGWSYGYRDYRWCEPYSSKYRTRYWYTGSLHGGSYGAGYSKHKKGDRYYTDPYGYDWIGAQGSRRVPAVNNQPLPQQDPRVQSPRLMDSRRGQIAREQARETSRRRADAGRSPSRERYQAPTRRDRADRTAQRAPTRTERPSRTTRQDAGRRKMMPTTSSRGSQPSRPTRASQPTRRTSAPARPSSRGGASRGNSPAVMPSRRGGDRGNRSSRGGGRGGRGG